MIFPTHLLKGHSALLFLLKLCSILVSWRSSLPLFPHCAGRQTSFTTPQPWLHGSSGLQETSLITVYVLQETSSISENLFFKGKMRRREGTFQHLCDRERLAASAVTSFRARTPEPTKTNIVITPGLVCSLFFHWFFFLGFLKNYL